MATFDSSDYARGSLYSAQDWYHGQLSRAEAKQALLVSGKDCFLVRESKGSLVLSLLYNQHTCHIKIKYGPGWYRLDDKSIPESECFTELDELLSYYRSHTISDKLQVTLGDICTKECTKASSNVYTKASPSISDKTWYHGKLTMVEAEQALAACDNDCFLVRESEGSLILSTQHNGKVQHLHILYGPGWYKLERSSEQSFSELDELVSHYRSSCISDTNNRTLGEPCERKGTSPLHSKLTSQGLYPKGEPADLLEHMWYHGNVSEEQATQELQAMKEDAFLVRQDGSNLIISIKVEQDVSHKKILPSPEGYRLEGRERVFPTIQEMTAHYKLVPIGNKVPKNTATLDKNQPEYATIATDPAKYKWYYGSISEEQAYIILRKMTRNSFLVRKRAEDLILTYECKGWILHEIIEKNEQGYHLQGKRTTFEAVPDLIAHYRTFPIQNYHILGSPCDKNASAQILQKLEQNVKKDFFRKDMENLNINWKKCGDMPKGVSVPQVVKINQHVYIGGGMRMEGDHHILRYGIGEDSWTLLPRCPTYQHSLATMNGELVVIGGASSNEYFGTVLTLRGEKWLELLPPMNTPRCLHSSVTHENRIIITAGGRIWTSERTSIITDAVEIYIKDERWYGTSKKLPIPLEAFTLTVVNDTCYILGGAGLHHHDSHMAVYCSIPSLIENSESADDIHATWDELVVKSRKWDKLEAKYPLACPALTEMNGKLLAFGGHSDTIVHHGTAFISMYDEATKEWIACKGAELPVPLYRSTVLPLGNNQVILVGGQPRSQQFSAEIFVGYLSID